MKKMFLRAYLKRVYLVTVHIREKTYNLNKSYIKICITVATIVLSQNYKDDDKKFGTNIDDFNYLQIRTLFR